MRFVVCGEGGSEVLSERAELQGDISSGAEESGVFSCGKVCTISFRFQVSRFKFQVSQKAQITQKGFEHE